MTSRKATTLLGENQGSDYAEYEDGLGKVRLWHFGHRISVFESSGGLKMDHATFIMDYHAKHLDPYERPLLAFGNWVHLQAYSPEVRKSLTDWQVRVRYDELYVAHDSRVLAMSIAVANAILPTTIVVYPTEEKLDDVFVDARRRYGV